MTAPFPFDGVSLLPHSGHARFVHEIREVRDNALMCVGRIPAESPFARDGSVSGYVLVELAAQAAAIEALWSVGEESRRPCIGYLVRAHDLSWTPDGVPTGALLTVAVVREHSMPPLYKYRATVTLGDAKVFGGGFSIYVDEEAV